MKNPDDKIIGRRVIVKACEAAEHGNNYGCVCDLIGKTVTIKRRYKTLFVGRSSYWIKGMKKTVMRSEVVLPRSKGKKK